MDPPSMEPYAVRSEVKTKKPPIFTLPKNLKTLEFYSTIGKTRLSRICDDSKLNEEVIFTGGWAGPSEAFVKEQVSDFVQHHLFRRHRRISLDRQSALHYSIKPNTNFEKRPTVFVHYEQFIKKTNECLDKKRREEEKARLVRMLISGEVRNAPKGLEWVRDEPHFKMNRIMERVRGLEHQDYSNLQPLPFSLKYIKPIRVINEKKICPEKISTATNLKIQNGTWQSNLNCIKKELIKPAGTSSTSASSLLLGTDSSGVTENNWTPSPTISSHAKHLATPRSTSAFTDEGIDLDEGNQEVSSSLPGLFEMDIPEPGRRKTGAIEVDGIYSLENIQDEDEMWSVAKQLYPDEDFSGELEIIHVNHFFNSEPVKLIQAEENCDKMYEVGSHVANLYERQEVVGNEFIEELTSQFFGK